MTNIEHDIDLYEFEIQIGKPVGKAHRLLSVRTPGAENLAGWVDDNDPDWVAYWEAVTRNDGEETGLTKPDWPPALLAERDAADDHIDLMLALASERAKRELTKYAREHGCADDEDGCGGLISLVETEHRDDRHGGLRFVVPAETARLWARRVDRWLADAHAELSA